MSDIAGVDIEAHNHDPSLVLKAIRDWLRTSVEAKSVPGNNTLEALYSEFRAELPAIADAAGLDASKLMYADYEAFVVTWLLEKQPTLDQA